MGEFAEGCGAAEAQIPELEGYAVVRELGRGSSGVVWLVTEEFTQRDFALKSFKPQERDSPAAIPGAGDAEDSVRREIRTLSVLDHEHLVKAHKVVRPDGAGGRLGLIMDYAAGGSLGQLMASREKLGAGETVTVLTPIAQALAYLHGQGFTHGDLSPGNVLFTAHGKPLLADLGVARMVADVEAVADAGTEGFRDPAPVDAVRAGLQPERDVYSLAALGWYCLTGRAPEPGAQRPPLPLLVPGVPAALAAALESGLQEDRRLRPSAAELAAAVHRSAVAAPVDLSVSVHPSVIPQLLTRRSLPGTVRERRIERLRALPRRFRKPRAPRPRARAGTPGTGRPARRAGARHSSRRGAAGPGLPGPRGFRAAAAGLAVLAVLVAAWGFAGAPLPPPLPGPPVEDARPVERSGPGPAASALGTAPPVDAAAVPAEIEAQLASPDPEEAVRGLARLRSLAFGTGNFRLLDQVNVPASSAAVADARISAGLEASGRVLAGFATLLTQVARTEDSTGPLTVVDVTARTSAYQERNADGVVMADAAATPEQQLRLVLAPVEGRWRIQDILPGDTVPPGAGATG
ncbi:MAG: serine/threonine-protein kinase [Arthrobacter sp.]